MATALIAHNNPWPIGNIQHWEETGAQLESALSAYLHSCLALEQSTSTVPSIRVDNLPARLDRRIEYFHTLMTQPLAQSLASVTRTRNKLVTSIYRIPPEVLGRIFDFAVNGSRSDLCMESAIADTCRCLHRILSVCSVWRKVGTAHAPLWTLVPIVVLNRLRIISMKSANLSLERAGRSNLRLAADIGDAFIIPMEFYAKLAGHGPRFRSANLCSSSPSTLQFILDSILETAVPGSLTELSLCIDVPRLNERHDSHYLFQHGGPSKQTAFERVFTNLRVLRLSNVLPRMGNAPLENLVELRIQEVVFGADTNLRAFLKALTTASQLETLDMISVEAYEVVVLPVSLHDLQLSLPRLQTIFLEDLTYNVLRTVLSIVKPGAHRTVLSVSNLSLVTQRQGIRLDLDITALHNVFQLHNIDTLLLTELWCVHDRGFALRCLLSMLPTLTTIYLDEQYLDRASLVSLTRTPDIPETFPRLRRIYISSCGIDDIGDQIAFKEMLSSHPLEEIVLGGSFSEVFEISEPGNGSNGDLEQVDIAGTDVRTISIKTWIQENVPKCKLLGQTEHFRFKWNEWQLW
ncbi:unnamed protein product [Rhizoctonia solani]|uniref:F-box domain-containing protein n=1 Tax=Rhizoctonia solani TaxID=456999 RepID=A0A8H3CWT7_9AGAM|nr:unnamed protein product [Rhizoctonia solani]